MLLLLLTHIICYCYKIIWKLNELTLHGIAAELLSLQPNNRQDKIGHSNWNMTGHNIYNNKVLKQIKISHNLLK